MVYPDLAQERPDLIPQFEELLEQWCRLIEGYLQDTLTSHEMDSGDPGPLAELEFWKNRMQKINSITEQVKSKEVDTSIGVTCVQYNITI